MPDTDSAQAAMDSMARSDPIPRADVEPRVYVRATDDWNELAARFAVPVRSARLVKDEVTRRVLKRFAAAGLRLASATSEVTVHRAAEPNDDAPSAHGVAGGAQVEPRW